MVCVRVDICIRACLVACTGWTSLHVVGGAVVTDMCAADISLQSATRSKANAFNWLHQLTKKVLLGGSKLELIKNFEVKGTSGGIREALGLGRAEAAAVSNLITKMPDAAVCILKASVAKHGIVRGAVSHAAIASPAFTTGFTPDVAANSWATSMKNTDEIVILMAERITEDYDAQPSGLRRPAMPADIAKLQKIVAVFVKAREVLRQRLPDATFQNEWPQMVKQFKSGAFDATFMNAAEVCPVPWKLEDDIPEFASLLSKVQLAEQKELTARSEELKLQVHAATFHALKADLELDGRDLETYYTDQIERRLSWQDVLLTHKRRRYLAGQSRVQEFMASQLQILDCDLQHLQRELLTFKEKFDQVPGGPQGTSVPWSVPCIVSHFIPSLPFCIFLFPTSPDFRFAPPPPNFWAAAKPVFADATRFVENAGPLEVTNGIGILKK